MVRTASNINFRELVPSWTLSFICLHYCLAQGNIAKGNIQCSFVSVRAEERAQCMCLCVRLAEEEQINGGQLGTKTSEAVLVAHGESGRDAMALAG